MLTLNFMKTIEDTIIITKHYTKENNYMLHDETFDTSIVGVSLHIRENLVFYTN